MIQNYTFPKKIKQRLEFDGYIFENVIIIQINVLKYYQSNESIDFYIK